MTMINVILYTRPDCHLCKQAEEDLESLRSLIPHKLTVINIDTDPTLKKTLLLEVPVVEIGPFHLKTEFSRQDLQMTLWAASDRLAQLKQINDHKFHSEIGRGESVTQAEKISLWLSRHYLFLFNLFLFLYFGLPFLAPIFMEAGLEKPANVIYSIYKPLCHQWSFRSWFLFGEQAYYPHEAANIPGVLSFEDVTGITDENDPGRVKAREFTGNDMMGFKIALCQRDEAIWGSMFLFGIIYALSGRRIKKLHWLLWIVIGLAPVGLDGLSQLVSQFPIGSLQVIFPYRESTPFLRTLTGALFGLATAWFTMPLIEETMAESRRMLNKKLIINRSQWQ